MKKTDALIIGKGPAGIQASLYLKRANVSPIIIGKDIGASEQAHQIDNFYGLPGISGNDLIKQGIKQAQDLEIEVLTDEVTSISYEDEAYLVKTSTSIYKATSVLLATGAHRNIPRIRRIRKFEAKGISYCAVCDAYFFRNKKLAVLGAGDYAASEVEVLLSITDHVTVFTNGEEITGDFPDNIEIITKRIRSVFGEEKLQGFEFRDGSTFEMEGLFVAIGVASSADLAKKLGVEVDAGRIVVNEEMSTAMPGLFAAGDCTPGVQQIAKAVGDGCVAGMMMVNYIRNVKRGL